MLYVYVLYSSKFNKHYTGYSSDLEQRLTSHNVFGKGYTAKYRPWAMIYSKSFDTKSAAMQYESWLNTGVGRAFISNLPKI